MSVVKTPQEKKEESYKHDRVRGYGNPHGARKSGPAAKALIRRQRRKIDNRTASSPAAQRSIDRTIDPYVRASQSLVENIQDTHRNRMQREARKLFSKGWSEERHAQFRKVVENWMVGRSQYLAALASYYGSVMQDLPEPTALGVRDTSRVRFLSRFFQHEPKLRQKFERWIEFMKTAP